MSDRRPHIYRFSQNPEGGIIYPEVTIPGGLWIDTAKITKAYLSLPFGGQPKEINYSTRLELGFEYTHIPHKVEVGPMIGEQVIWPFMVKSMGVTRPKDSELRYPNPEELAGKNVLVYIAPHGYLREKSPLQVWGVSRESPLIELCYPNVIRSKKF